MKMLVKSRLQSNSRTRSATIQEADHHRDRGQAAEAAALYGRVIDLWGADFAILVQWGNALKDSGEFEQAEMAYGRALNIYPLDADCHLQLGHLMKLQRRLDRARDFYAEALRLDPEQEHAALELLNLAGHQAARAVRAARREAGAEAIDRGTRLTILRQRMLENLAFRRN